VAHLGVPHGEDALTWNVFRSADLGGRLEVVQRFFALKSTIDELLFWGCDPDGKSELQQRLSILIRELDGKRKGNITEIDLAIITRTEVCFVEIKLKSYATPWTASEDKERVADGKTPGWQKRWADYRQAGFDLPPAPSESEKHVYQLVRNAVYAKRLADDLGKQVARVCSLMSRSRVDIYPIVLEQYENFKRVCPFLIVDPILYWEDLPDFDPEVSRKLQETLDRLRDA